MARFEIRTGCDPLHHKNRRDRHADAGLQERHRPHVAEQATVIGRVMLLVFGSERAGLRKHRDEEQADDEERSAVPRQFARHFG